MATRSAIAVQTPKGIRAIYCHWDGYPEHHLPILKDHYGNKRKASALIAPGFISILRTCKTWAAEDARDPQPLYYHERGDQDVKPRLFADLEGCAQWAADCGCEHFYLYLSFSGWRHLPLEGCPFVA